MKFNSVIDILNGVKFSNEQARRLLYKLLQNTCYPTVKAYIYNNGGNSYDAEDKFQDAMIALFKSIENKKFELKTTSAKSHVNQLSAFTTTIVKNLWLKELRWRNRPTLQVDDITEEDDDAFEILPGVVKEVFAEMPAEEKEIMKQFFYNKKSYTKIANELNIGLSTEQVKKQMASSVESLLTKVRSNVPKVLTSRLIEITHESMKEIGERCRKILSYFYMEKKSMDEIAKLMDYSSAHSVREQKFRCMRNLNIEVTRKLLKQEKN